MSSLNFSTYADALRPAFVKHTGKQDAAILLLNAVSEPKLPEKTQKGKDIELPDGSYLNRVLRGVQPVPESIRAASAKPKAVESTASYFRKEVMQDIHPQLKDEATERLRKLISEDATIPETKKDSLLALSKGDDYGRFLSDTFLYALNRPVSPESENENQKISVALLIFLFLFGVAIYGMTMYTLIKMGTFSQALMAFAFFFAIGLFVFLIGFYFFLWRRDI